MKSSVLAVVPFACLAVATAAQAPATSDAFVEVARDAAEALEKATEAVDDVDARVDALRAALGATDDAGLVPAPGDDALRPVLFLDVRDAVREHLRTGGPRLREAWRTRHGSGGVAPGAELAPGTPAAARALLVRVDVALERGATAEARALLVELTDDLALLDGNDPELPAAVARRRAWLARREPTTEAPPTGTRLAFVERVPLADSETRFGGERHVAPGAGLRPGLTSLADGRVVVQTPSLLHVLAREADGGFAEPVRVDLLDLVDRDFVNTSLPYAAPGAPGWPLVPGTDGERLFVVQGRTRAEEEPNALVAIELDARTSGWRPRRGTSELATPARLAWGRAGDRFLADVETGRLASDADLAALASAEFLPGPLVVDDLVLVGARTYAGAVEAWLVAFRVADGELAWARRLASGSDLVESAGRFGSTTRLAAGLLAAFEGLVLAPTHLGTASLVRAADGRILWTIRVPRRDREASGWDGGPARAVRGADGGPPTRLVWAPSDADRRFLLDFPRPSLDQLVGRTSPGDDRVLVDVTADGAWVLGRAGRHETLRWDGVARRLDALHLEPEERFRGHALRLGDRLVASTGRGAYLFDLGRELYLLDFEPSDPRAGERQVGGGDVHSLGEGDLLVLEREAVTLWTLR